MPVVHEFITRTKDRFCAVFRVGQSYLLAHGKGAKILPGHYIITSDSEGPSALNRYHVTSVQTYGGGLFSAMVTLASDDAGDATPEMPARIPAAGKVEQLVLL